MTDSPTMAAIIQAARALVQSVTFDDSGAAGQGGNGGLLSRGTIRKADELRLALNDHERSAR